MYSQFALLSHRCRGWLWMVCLIPSDNFLSQKPLSRGNSGWKNLSIARLEAPEHNLLLANFFYFFMDRNEIEPVCKT